MADTGWVSCGTGADNAAAGSLTWATPGNITADGGGAALAMQLSSTPAQTHQLRATNFGFAIPTGATIVGVEAKADAMATIIGAAPTFYSVKLLVGGSVVGDEQAASEALTGSYADYTFGGATDLWGATPGESDVENSGFGVAIQCELHGDDDGYEMTSVDHVQMKVHYTEAAAVPERMVMATA